ncbi:patatin-like phospholipase family protein [Runella sp.]|uniref:patatin-like phospholipase family protein n=1 Tax=Runella sp. TaxID=1960881 RepID=UPI003D12F2DF
MDPIQSKKRNLINEARRVLNGQSASIKDLEELCKKLVKLDQFGYASEVLLAKLVLKESLGEPASLEEQQNLVKYIYKDPTLPASFKFKKALCELNISDQLTKTNYCETLGLAGAIYKRLWQYNHQFKNLILSRYYYQKGYALWKEFLVKNSVADKSEQNDEGYTAINYAYVNELMAVDKLEEHGRITGTSPSIADRLTETEEVRTFIIDKLTEFEGGGKFDREKNKWVYQTIAEAYFGLRRYESAAEYIKKYLDIRKTEEAKTPNLSNDELEEKIAWEVRTFHQQMLSIAYLQLFQSEYVTKYITPKGQAVNPHEIKLGEIAKEIDLDKINSCLNHFRITPSDAPDIKVKKDGKLGLALSGGGFRASLFHIGVLAALAETEQLKDVEVISCVSGGSIIGAYYYLKLKTLLDNRQDENITATDYIGLIKEIETGFLKGVQKNLRLRLLTNPIKTLKMLFSSSYSRTHRMGELYEEFLYKGLLTKVGQTTPAENLYMSDLRIEPGKDASFNIAIDNWQRINKVPQLILNATSLNTGHNWQFTASWMGEPPGMIQADIDVKPRLRRMYYPDAPLKYQNFRLGYAVGASSCVPVLFKPMPLPDLYPGIDLQLVDGGVHDNQGIGALIEQECSNMIISDASGQMPTKEGATGGLRGVFFRSDTILQERVRELQFKDIEERNQTTQIRKLVKIHLKDDLQRKPISWKNCMDPPRKIMYGSDEENDTQLTKYGILRNVQQLLSEIRTDLDSFHDTEAYALMYSGYRQTYCKLGQTPPQTGNWKFLEMEKFMTRSDEAEKIIPKLTPGNRLFFKAFYLIGIGKLLKSLITFLGVVLVFYAVYRYYDASWVPFIKYLGKILAGTALGFLLFTVLIRLYSEIIHPLYNKLGSMSQKKNTT